jgi:hypothetical protein
MQAFRMVLGLVLATTAWAQTPGPASTQRLSRPAPLNIRSDPDFQDIPSRTLSASDLSLTQGAYYGSVVRIRSQVVRALSPHAFLLSDDPLSAAPEVLVIVPEPRAQAPLEYMLSVVGTVQPFEQERLQADYAWFNRELFRDTSLWEHGAADRVPVVVARSVQTERGLELVRLPSPEPVAVGVAGSVQTGTGRSGVNAQVTTTLATLLEWANTVALAGSRIVLGPVLVQRVFDPQFLAVGNDLEHAILIRLSEPRGDIVAGDVVNISGVIEKSLPSSKSPGLVRVLPVFIQAESIKVVRP